MTLQDLNLPTREDLRLDFLDALGTELYISFSSEVRESLDYTGFEQALQGSGFDMLAYLLGVPTKDLPGAVKEMLADYTWNETQAIRQEIAASEELPDETFIE